MIARRRAALAAVLAALVALVALVGSAAGGPDASGPYTLRLQLDNAFGLRDGSLVTVGGVEVGKVDVELDDEDRVLVRATLDEGQKPIGRDARAFITSVNLLGQKRLELVRGDETKPQPSGAVIPPDRVTQSTDLDEVLAVLTPDVRARLNVLINELGATVVGRDKDIAQLINTLPSTISKATEVVDRVTYDSNTLARVVERSDRLVAGLTAERRAISGLVDSAGRAAGSVVDKRAELRATLAKAPGTLRTLREFLAELERTTGPLGPAARDIAGTAPELVRTMDQLAPFQKAAAPVLDQATDVAPELAKLADGATPVLRRAVPTLQRLTGTATDLEPVTAALDQSIHNLIGTVDNWSRAVQYRDGLSHIFRGEAGISQQTLEGVLQRYLKLLDKDQKKPAKERNEKAAPARPAPSLPKVDLPQVKPPKVAVPKTGVPKVDEVVDGVKDLVGLGDKAAQPDGAGARPLLDFLLNP